MNSYNPREDNFNINHQYIKNESLKVSVCINTSVSARGINLERHKHYHLINTKWKK